MIKRRPYSNTDSDGRIICDEINGMKVVTLQNGVRIGNFCSSHSFVFSDGTYLPASSQDRLKKVRLIGHYRTKKDNNIKSPPDDLSVLAINVLSNHALEELRRGYEGVDFILTSHIVADAIRQYVHFSKDQKVKNTYIKHVRLPKAVKSDNVNNYKEKYGMDRVNKPSMFIYKPLYEDISVIGKKRNSRNRRKKKKKQPSNNG